MVPVTSLIKAYLFGSRDNYVMSELITSTVLTNQFIFIADMQIPKFQHSGSLYHDQTQQLLENSKKIM